MSRGKLTVVTGVMGGGKTETLIRMVQDIGRHRCQIFKPSIDDRFDTTSIRSRNGHAIEGVALVSNETVNSIFYDAIDGFTIVVDECQFLTGIASVAKRLLDKGYNLLFAGLASDFRCEPFGEMGELLAIADEIIHIPATCAVCGGTATKTQRLINDEPAHCDDPIILVGGNELYEPRCNKHWAVRNG